MTVATVRLRVRKRRGCGIDGEPALGRRRRAGTLGPERALTLGPRHGALDFVLANARHASDRGAIRLQDVRRAARARELSFGAHDACSFCTARSPWCWRRPMASV